MTVAFEYAEGRWRELEKRGYSGVKDGRSWESCVVCGKAVYLDTPHFWLEIAWTNSEALDPEVDLPEHSQGMFPIGPGCLRKNPQLKRLAVAGKIEFEEGRPTVWTSS